MTWYQEGTVSVTQNSSGVTGVSTRWVSNARVGEALIGPDGRIYEISAIASDKALTISPAYKGVTAAGQAYAIVPVQGYVKRLADQAARVLNTITVGLSEKVDTSELPQAVRDTVLEGIAFDVTTAVLASDTVLQALGKLQAQASSKVDKVSGKVLSSNDFTNAERVKLANIAEQATKNASDAALRDRSTHTGTQAIATVVGLQAALDALVSVLSIGPLPNQVPSNQHLGDLAFMGALGATQVTQHARDSQPGDVWHEWVSNTQLKKKFHGLDGVIRTITETYA